MRRLAFPLGLVLGLLVASSVFAAGQTAFNGEWIGNDPGPPDGDGSTVHLYITGGERPHVRFTDEYGSVCDLVGSDDKFFESSITGIVLKNAGFVGSFRSASCGDVPVKFLKGVMVVMQLDNQGNDDPSDDTIDDGLVTWSRV
jgi:hypothetical protein